MFWSMIVFLGPSQSHNLRLTERAKMTLSRAQYIVMLKNINFVLFHCKGTFGPERYLRRRLEICRTLRTFKCALSLIREWMWTFRCPPRDLTAVCQYVDVNWWCELVKTTAYDQNNDIQWYFHIFKAQKKIKSPAKQFKELFRLCPNHFRWNGMVVSEV